MSNSNIVGWRELVDLPEWGLRGIRAKSDTGARSSALDVRSVEELDGDRVRFEVVIDRTGTNQLIEAPIVRRTKVRSSFGEAHSRLFVIAKMTFAGQTIEAEVGLVSRKNMLCQMLLGRQTLNQGPFLVDPGRTYLHGRKKASKPAKSATETSS